MMKKKRRTPVTIEQVEIIDAGAEGVAVAKPGEKVVFIPFGAPGDVVDVEVFKKKRNYFEGRILHIHKESDKRTSPACSHFGLCGGCKWQHLDYTWQLHFKQKQVKDSLERIAHIEAPDIRPILRSDAMYYYRNKLEFTFSNRKWLLDGSPSGIKHEDELKGLGFHLPGMFDRILEIEHCYLQADPSNAIRLAVRDYAMKHGIGFYDIRAQDGLLRNLIIRNSLSGEVMVIVVTGASDIRIENGLLPYLTEQFPAIKSLIYVVNPKGNDTINDLPFQVIKGEPYIVELMASPIAGFPPLRFRIGPVSFYQTNPVQAERLYRAAYDFAGFDGNEVVYDLYTGTGTIANYIARSVKKVVGIEYVEEAVADARINSEINNIHNTTFVAGDMSAVLDETFSSAHGRPDVIITDPPRAGMHPKVVAQLMALEAPKIVYISCNPATQARDLVVLKEKYAIAGIQPVDMFPQTQHVENIVLLTLK